MGTGTVRVTGGVAQGEIPEWKLLYGMTQLESATKALPGPESQPDRRREHGEPHSPGGGGDVSALGVHTGMRERVPGTRALINAHPWKTTIFPTESCLTALLLGPSYVERGYWSPLRLF